jgi:deoxyribose-phosphate aldolase
MRIDLTDLKPRCLDREFVAVVENDEEPETVTAIVDAAYLAYLENEVRELRALSTLSTF